MKVEKIGDAYAAELEPHEALYTTEGECGRIVLNFSRPFGNFLRSLSSEEYPKFAASVGEAILTTIMGLTRPH